MKEYGVLHLDMPATGRQVVVDYSRRPIEDGLPINA